MAYLKHLNYSTQEDYNIYRLGLFIPNHFSSDPDERSIKFWPGPSWLLHAWLQSLRSREDDGDCPAPLSVLSVCPAPLSVLSVGPAPLAVSV